MFKDLKDDQRVWTTVIKDRSVMRPDWKGVHGRLKVTVMDADTTSDPSEAPPLRR